ncbi:MAG: hypothetical protein O3C34_19130 [Proteobacteria bacterium]|nr:hypothetical protein [Pseudomonadota bacterium]
MKQEHEAIRTDIRIARIVTGAILGALFAATVMFGNAIAAKPAGAEEALKLWNDRTVVDEALAKTYAEVPRSLGITSEGAVLELFTAEDGETWTIMITLPSGQSRIIATGEHWINRPMLAKGGVS